jgi:hypothetical protein
MRKLEAKRDKGRYKSTSHWLDAVYRNNKEFIDSKLKNVKTTNKKRVFKNLVLEQSGTRFKGSLTNKELNFELNKVKNPTKALKKLSRSDAFSSYKERAQENFYNVLKEHKAINRIKKIAGEKERFNPERLEWNYKEKAYRYGDVFVEIDNSPEDKNYTIKITKISPDLMRAYGYV